MSNYPPGVTGNEDVFGPKTEQDVTIESSCYHCPWEGEVLATRVQWNFGGMHYFDCPQCGTENELEIPESDGWEAADEDWGDEDARIMA